MPWEVLNLCKLYENSISRTFVFNIYMVYYLTSPYLLPFHHCWEIRRARGWLEERETDGERKWEALRELEICWVRNSERMKRQWGGNIGSSCGGSSGLVHPPSICSHRGWMACYIMPASISFSKATTRDTIPLHHHTHTSHKAHYAHNIRNVS